MNWILLPLSLPGTVLAFFGFAIIRQQRIRSRERGVMDAKSILSVTILLCTAALIWTFRYESYGYEGSLHRNRLTGVVCYATDECWLKSEQGLKF